MTTPEELFGKWRVDILAGPYKPPIELPISMRDDVIRRIAKRVGYPDSEGLYKGTIQPTWKGRLIHFVD